MYEKEDIPRLLALFIEEKKNQHFQWSVNDCCTFTSDWIAMRCGIDPAVELRDKYSTSLGAARVLKARGGVEQIAKDFCEQRGWPEISLPMAKRGDIVMMETQHGPAIGICLGQYSAFTGEIGVQNFPTLSCGKAWRVF